MAFRFVSRIRRIPNNARFGVLLLEADEQRLDAWMRCLARADRTMVATSTRNEAFAALASGFVPDVVVASMSFASDVFGTMSAMPKYDDTLFVAVTTGGFDAADVGAADRLARVVDAFLVSQDDDGTP